MVKRKFLFFKLPQTLILSSSARKIGLPFLIHALEPGYALNSHSALDAVKNSK